jgi:RNA recognition motif-containing protein
MMVPSWLVLPPTPNQVIKNSFLHFNNSKGYNGKRRRCSCPPRLEYKEKHVKSLADISPEITTLMIRNLPTRFTPMSLIRLFEDCGFYHAFDFFYCPIDFKTSKNQGYCFINFIHPEYAQMFASIFHGTRLGITTSTKILNVSGSRRQGLKENVCLFRGSDLLSSCSLPFYKPFVLMFGDLLPLSESLFEIIMAS